MFNKITKKLKKQTKLEREIEEILVRMSVIDRQDEEYKTLLSHVEALYKAKANEPVQKPFIDANTVLTVVGSLIGILLILKYEEEDSITSKAIGFIIKGRV